MQEKTAIFARDVNEWLKSEGFPQNENNLDFEGPVMHKTIAHVTGVTFGSCGEILFEVAELATPCHVSTDYDDTLQEMTSGDEVAVLIFPDGEAYVVSRKNAAADVKAVKKENKKAEKELQKGAARDEKKRRKQAQEYIDSNDISIESNIRAEMTLGIRDQGNFISFAPASVNVAINETEVFSVIATQVLEILGSAYTRREEEKLSECSVNEPAYGGLEGMGYEGFISNWPTDEAKKAETTAIEAYEY